MTDRALRRWLMRGGVTRWLFDAPTALPLSTGSMGMWAASLCLTGSLLGLVVTLLLPHASQYGLNLVTNGLLSAGGIFLTFKADKIGRVGANTIMAVGTFAITLQVATGHGMDPAILACMLYAWIAVYVFAFLSTVEAIAHIGFIATCYTLALVFGQKPSAPLADWVLTLATVLVTSGAVGYLSYQLRKQAVTDSLTGIPNRKGWEVAFEREMARARRSGSSFVIAIFDLNDFKQINDLYGHSVGDRVLVETGKALRAALRPYDLVVRWGGDEFVVLALLKHPAEGGPLIDRLMRSVRTNSALSCGAVIAYPGTANAQELLARADEALYRAKENPEIEYLLESVGASGQS
ncbi:MAG: GGDEF domain-containing protein [Actinomycetota bacterium]|nr:GGDEF domain-containing protein [Actinomycetota bacterium]